MCSTAEINTDVFITEIQKRPPLYNVKLKEYSDKNVKKKLWSEVCETCINNWNEMEPAEKDKKGQELQKKWKNLRTCFKREYELQKNEPSGSGAKKRRKYIFFDQLLFLKDSIEQRETVNNFGKTDSPTDAMEEVEDDSEVTEDLALRPKKISCRKRNLEPRKTYEESLLEILKNKRDEDREIDEDKYFLLSLLPEFKTFSRDQKFYAKTEMMTLMRKIRLSGNDSQQLSNYNQFVTPDETALRRPIRSDLESSYFQPTRQDTNTLQATTSTQPTMLQHSTSYLQQAQACLSNEPSPSPYQALSPGQEWESASDASSYINIGS